MAGWLRLCVRLTGFLLFLAGTTLLALALRAMDYLTGSTIDRTPWAGRCFRVGCRCLGLRIRHHGAEPAQNVLIVSNHISWCDIPILGAFAPARFLSKAEVGQWPLIGWLARQAGTLFIQRGSGQARRVRTGIEEALKRGESVTIFPEGTTSAGITVLPFHGLLLKAATAADVPVQPVTIAYRRNGRPDHVAPFIGDDEFHHHLTALLKQPSADVDVLFHQPMELPETATAQEAAAELRATVHNGLERIYRGEMDQAPASGNFRTEDAPERSHPPSPPGAPQSQGQSTA